jgi:hypothetical protein
MNVNSCATRSCHIHVLRRPGDVRWNVSASKLPCPSRTARFLFSRPIIDGYCWRSVAWMPKQARATGANARFAHCDQVQKLDTAPESKAQWDVHKITRSLLQYQQDRGPRERSTASPQISEAMGDATNLVQVKVKEKAKNIAPSTVRLFPLFLAITFFCQCTQSPTQIIFLVLQSSYCSFPTSLPIIVHSNDNGKSSFVPLSLSQFCHLLLVPYLLHSLTSLRLLFYTFIPCSTHKSPPCPNTYSRLLTLVVTILTMTMTRGPDITSGRLYAAANMRRFKPTALIASDSPIYDDIIHVEPEQDHQHHSSHNWCSGHQSDSNKVQDGVRTSSPTKLSPDFTAGKSWCEMSHDLRTKNIGDYLSSLMKSPSLDDEQKLAILTSFPPSVLGAVYERHIATNGPPRIPASPASSPTFYGPSEETYLPLTKDAMASPNPSAPPPIYPAYVGHFTTSEQARRYRKRARLPPKSHALDVERVRRYGRKSRPNLTARQG